MCYGQYMYGLAPTMRRELDTATSRCIFSCGFPACHNTKLFLQIKCIPSCDHVVGLVAWWTKVWTQSDSHARQQIVVTWRKLRDKLTPMQDSRRWSHVTGPISATISALLENNWMPYQPDCWHDKELGEVANLNHVTYANAAIVNAFRISVYRRSWRKASEHFAGGGLEEGPPSFYSFEIGQ